MSKTKRLKAIDTETFKALLAMKRIRPASLEDVYGTHHKRALYQHPNTGAYYVSVQ